MKLYTRPGYYWILDGPSRVYCGISYSGPTCIYIYITRSITCDKAGYYLLANNWDYCDMVSIDDAFSRGELITSCVGMGSLWRRIASFNIAAGDNCKSPWIKSTHNSINFCRSPSDDAGCYSVMYSSSGIHSSISSSTQDDIEVRICMDQEFFDEAVLITNLQLYIQ